MSSPSRSANPPPLDLSKWRNVPTILMVVGGVGALIGAFVGGLQKQFAFSWLQAFMFFLSLCLGAQFLVLVHHLFDASWSVPIRRISEHMACLAPVMAALFLPIAFLAKTIYPWMNEDPHADHALLAKQPLFTVPMFYVVAAICFLCWWFFSSRLRYWSLKQDTTGAVECTQKMRVLSCLGIAVYALSLTLTSIMWIKALQHQWFSTMYGVYYFASCVWTTLATVYVLTYLLERQGYLKNVIREKQYYFIGSLFFAFTVFYAYVHFAQYFIIWNGNMPEETFWYVMREKGTWWDMGMIIIFGHFFLPFLSLLRIDIKLSWFMFPMGVWAWLMNWVDMSFNIMPVLHPDGFVLHWLDIACFAFIGGVLAKIFLKNFLSHPPYPQRDPRMAEGLDVYVTPISTAPRKPQPAGERAR